MQLDVSDARVPPLRLPGHRNQCMMIHVKTKMWWPCGAWVPQVDFPGRSKAVGPKGCTSICKKYNFQSPKANDCTEYFRTTGVHCVHVWSKHIQTYPNLHQQELPGWSQNCKQSVNQLIIFADLGCLVHSDPSLYCLQPPKVLRLKLSGTQA